MFNIGINPKKIKTQNTSYLKSIGIDVIDHLPYVKLNEFQDKKDISKRCLVLAALLQLHFEAPNEFIENWLKENNLIKYLTPKEQKILNTNHSDLLEQDQTDLYWSIESIWTFAWVGNKHSNLTFNTEVEDTLANFLPSFENNESGNEFIENFSIRSEKEIFTKLDQFYRAHWFSKNKELTNEEGSVTNIDVVMERRKALEWVCNKNEDWDDISLDT